MEKNTEAIKSNLKSPMIQLVIAVCGVFVAVFGLSMFNQHLLMSFPLPLVPQDFVKHFWIEPRVHRNISSCTNY